ncbi:MAG: hypothetical protein PWP65_875 [Clostridia bacterium]|nr:hypothetical protein [Clostridia bacterium]
METLKERFKERCKRGILQVHYYTRSAVLLPLLRDGRGDWRVLFEVRSAQLKAQPGEICFPGGRVDDGDADECEAAVREACEELQIPPSSIEIWGDLGVLMTPFQQILYPFVGVLLQPERITPNPREVEEVFTLRLASLLAVDPAYHQIPIRVHPPDDFPFEKIPGGRNYPWREGFLPEFFYELEGRIIWGLTARILHSFLEVIR